MPIEIFIATLCEMKWKIAVEGLKILGWFSLCDYCRCDWGDKRELITDN